MIYFSVQLNMQLWFITNQLPGVNQSSTITNAKSSVNKTTLFTKNSTAPDYGSQETGKIVAKT